MISFENDYSEGMHEEILAAFARTNLIQTSGYGTDSFCESAKEKIRRACECPDAEIFFLVGGTQTNQTVIDSLLRSYEGVVAAATGHINVHEAGAVEFTGHKVLALPEHDGKLCAKELDDLVSAFWQDPSHEHTVFPGMVYISHPTEYGTLYTKEELTALSETCRKWKLPLFMDGARLGYGLMSKETDLTLPEIAELVDVFYIGGTKVGCLCGEAVVFTKKNMPAHFVAIVKQHGALLAKGRVLGVQFDTLFTDDLYFKISAHAIEMAELLKKGFHEKGIRFFLESPTNQQFVILENEFLEKLSEKAACTIWGPYDEAHTIVRFVTSWATTPEMIAELMEYL